MVIVMLNKYIINHAGKIEKINDFKVRNGRERINGVYYDRVVILAKYNGVYVELWEN